MACRPISILTYTVLKNEQAAWREEVVHMQQESVMKKKFFVTGTGENSYREWRKPMDLKGEKVSLHNHHHHHQISHQETQIQQKAVADWSLLQKS